jgi:hypothetical protein
MKVTGVVPKKFELCGVTQESVRSSDIDILLIILRFNASVRT